jgi:predicted metal-binding membrane protein
MQTTSLLDTIRTIPRTALAIAGALGAFTILAWLVVAQSNMPMAGTLDPVALILFTLIWGIGMVAMMFPSLVPMAYTITVHATKSIDQTKNSPSLERLIVPARAALFILGYVAIWTLVGVLFYLAFAGLVIAGLPSGYAFIGPVAGAILIATGLYQFTRFKLQSLMKCRHPLGFIMTRWRDGTAGAGTMGLDYGLFCTKCCWVLMAGLLTVGTMSTALMGVFALIIFAEKVGPYGALVTKIIGIAFLAVGIYLMV